MRPLKLSFESFNSYANKTSIDFEDFNSNGIFLITGPTGSGKTTIFDAIKYALYGVASGEDRKNISNFSDFANLESPSTVTFEFLHRGVKYRIERISSYQVPKKDKNLEADKRTLTQKTTVNFYQLIDGEEKLLASNATKVNEEVQNLLGIDKNQFSQIVMIAQGDFSKILTAKGSDREILLRNIFNTEVYQQLQERLKADTSQLEKEHEKNLAKAKNALQDINLNDQEQSDKVLEYLNNEKTILSHLDEIHTFIEEQNSALNKEAHSLDSKTIKLSNKKDALTQNLALVQSNQKIKDQISACNEYLDLHKPILDQKKSAYDQAKKNEVEIEKLRSDITKLEEKIVRYDSASKQVESIELEISKLDSQLLEHKRQIGLLEKKSAETQTQQNELKEKKQHLEANSNKLTEIDRLISEIEQTVKRKENADVYSEKLDEEQIALEELSIKYNQSEEAYQSAEQKFNAAQAGILASKLIEGSPCPVCGSIHHPQIASLSNNVPSETEIKKLKDTMESIRQKKQKQSEAAATSKTKFDFENNEFKQSFTHVLSAVHLIDEFKNVDSFEELMHANEVLIQQKSAIESQNKEKEILESRINKTDIDLKNIEENKTETNNSIQELTDCLNLRNGALLSIKNSGDLIDIDKIKICHDNAVARWEILSNQLHQSKEEFDKESFEFENQKSFCQKLKNQIDNTLCIDPSDLKDQIQEIDIKQQEIRNKITEINHMISINESPLNTIKRIYHDAIATEKKYNTTKTLYDFVSGKSSNSESGCISLENYVQRTYLQRVVGAANDRLAVMTDSQFVLKTKGDKKYKKKEYLDLEVTDLYTGKDRDVKSLSGGEKFMTSLALALGFSDVIQQDAGGIQLDSMFIDEGFGTLDSETLEQALRLLDQLSTNSNTLVGIISHVEELKNRIPQQIVVSKDLNGSSLEVVIK
ncbi:MAG: SMC family ATPase [Clostridium perfringens]|nr:SMC family ATPase [Clostridium perfringens]